MHEKINFKNQIDNLNCFIDTILSSSTDNKQQIINHFNSYHKTLTEQSEKLNLISKNDLNILYTRHFIDSLIPFQLYSDFFLTLKYPIKIIDIGSGAGFPGTAWKLFNHKFDITFVESIAKKCDFLTNLKNNLHLENMNILNLRAEELAYQPLLRENFDIAITRASAKPLIALELLLPFISLNGSAFFWCSGPEWNNIELIAKITEKLGGKICSNKEYILPEDLRPRTILHIKKISKTAITYPRIQSIRKDKPITI